MTISEAGGEVVDLRRAKGEDVAQSKRSKAKRKGEFMEM